MKCDKLKAMSAVDAYEEYENNIIDESKHHYYNKQEVNEAIAELKEKYKKLTKDHDHAIQACCDADKAISELKAEIEILKNAHYAEIGDLEDSHLEEITYLGMENYRLKEQIRKYKMMRAFYNADVCIKKSAGANSEKKLQKWLNRYERWIDIAYKLKEKK